MATVATQSKVFLMKEIISMTAQNNNKLFYSNIFHSLTDNNKLKNYSTNSNGIFFNLSEVSITTLQKTYDLIKNYVDNDVLNTTYEEERANMISEYTNTFDLKYNPVDDISDYISNFSEPSSRINSESCGGNVIYRGKRGRKTEDDESSEDNNEREFEVYNEPKDKYVDYELFGDDSDNEY